MNLRAIPSMLGMIRLVCRGVEPGDLERIKAIVQLAYPSVPQLSARTLLEWLEVDSDAGILLVDTRTPEEYAVSHLRGAVNLTQPGEIVLAMKELKPARTVLYCSVGFRSSRLARRVAEKTDRDVFNLAGSLFEWANEGRLIYQGERCAQQVHPYGRRWAGLLKPGLAAHSMRSGGGFS